MWLGIRFFAIKHIRLVQIFMVKKWQLRIHSGYIIKVGDNGIKGNESEVVLVLKQARNVALNYVERRGS